MSYPRVEPASPAAAPTQDEVDAASRRRALDGFHRCVALLAGALGRDWRHCGKAACRRSRRCRGFACEPDPADYAATKQRGE